MDEHDELLHLADEYWDSVLEAFPLLATQLGDRRFDDRVEDLSIEAEDALRARWRRLLDRVDALDSGSLDDADRVTRRLLRAELASEADGRPLRSLVDGMRVASRAMSWGPMSGIHADWLSMAPQLEAPTPESARMLVERHRQLGRLLDRAADRFRAELAAGRTPARLVVARSVSQLDSYLGSDLASDPFVSFAGPAGWDGEPGWRDQLTEVTREVIRPAFQRYRDVLANELLPAARSDERCGLVWWGEDGERLYRSLVRLHTTLEDPDVDEIHGRGLTELDRLATEYAEVGSRLFGTASLPEIFARLRDDPELRYRDRGEIMATARRCLDAAAAAMGDWFGRLPRESCEIEPMPEYLAADGVAAMYHPPAADGSRPGTFYVNPHDPAERTRFETAAMTFHEAIPGHHLQLAIANELAHLPRFQRASPANTAYVEGWALYSERLADEMGLYRDDLDRLGMLALDSWRSCRLVVDTGLHAKGWSRQQAIDFMVDHVPIGRHDIEVEVDRYVDIAGQALGYKTGQLEIQRLRGLAEAREGRSFDLKAFHDTVLGSGAVSLPILRDLVGV